MEQSRQKQRGPRSVLPSALQRSSDPVPLFASHSPDRVDRPSPPRRLCSAVFEQVNARGESVSGRVASRLASEPSQLGLRCCQALASEEADDAAHLHRLRTRWARAGKLASTRARPLLAALYVLHCGSG